MNLTSMMLKKINALFRHCMYMKALLKLIPQATLSLYVSVG